MKIVTKISIAAAIAVLVALSMSFLLKPDYTKSSVAFKIKNAGIGVDGSFTKFETSIDFNESAGAPSSIKATIETATINTGIEARDKHLKKEEFFDVEKYPKISFESTQILKTTSGSLIAEGKLTIKNVTKDIKIPFTYTAATGVFEGTVTLNRLDYGVGGKSMTMADEVQVAIKITTTK
ncbi:MAG: YceI family protein [Cytophaga sp.]|uniref:YceI family protein n=1 Tax=Cytophaga sp. TaxID=29535 RepID=UPI003F80E9DB